MIGTKKEIIDYLLDKPNDKKYEIKEKRNKRSLNANSYMWELCTQIAEVLGSSKDEIYLLELKKYGQAMLIPVPKNKKPDGYFKYYEFESRRKLNGVIVDFYKVYKGSSDYDTKEMSILIDGVVSDCKELEIPTLDDIKISQLKSNWG